MLRCRSQSPPKGISFCFRVQNKGCSLSFHMLKLPLCTLKHDFVRPGMGDATQGGILAEKSLPKMMILLALRKTTK
ncbi:MAG TPA: hypothetical protein VKS79_08580 [Gemmataceae bacterium]|nr:hypothetical protein [Gemmataceae bacterium]